MRDPSELYETLCRRRRAYGAYGMLSSACGDLEPPLLREESDALQEWLTCGGGPRGDLGMIAALQHHWFTAYQAERATTALRWRHVLGGRASHAFVGDADVPLCGVRPVRANGTTPRWRDYQDRYSRRARHTGCVHAAKEAGHPIWN